MKIENLTMNIGIKFNRSIDKEKDFISVGGFEMVMGDKNIQFDFETSYGTIYGDGDKYCEFELVYPDVECFPDMRNITEEDLKSVSKIIECYVYTGEDTCLYEDEIEHITFYVNEKVFPISIGVLDKYNIDLIDNR